MLPTLMAFGDSPKIDKQSEFAICQLFGKEN